jgi:mRNA-binding protein PUF3
MSQTQPASWAAASNKFHMPCVDEGDGVQEDINPAAPNKDASQVAAELDAPPSANEGETQEMPEEPKAHEVAPTSDCTLPDDVVALGNPRDMLSDQNFASSVLDLMEESGREKRAAIVMWMQPVVLGLAFSGHGTRIIQKAIELTGGQTQIMLSLCLHGRVRQLLDSHHGNHVLQQSIVMMPSHAVQFIFNELAFFRGGWAAVACHRFGCRVVERLLEHCDAGLTAPIVAAVVADIDSLSRHPFANYVVQHILEYVPAHRSQVVQAIIHVGAPIMAQHRVASNIVERAFEHSGPEHQQALTEAILSTPGAIVDMSCSRYGSFTVRRMLEALQGTLRYMALQQLGEAIPQLQASKPGRPIARRVLFQDQ